MPLLIDGHNLIPKIPGLSLSDPDDEMQLLSMLQEYCRLQRQQVECFFDQAPVGRPPARTHGTIHVKFARPGQTADDEIKKRLASLEKKARNYTVVSSDHSVQAAARSARAAVKSSDVFAQELVQTLKDADSQDKTPKDRSDDIHLSQEEVDMWMQLFKTRKKD